MPEMSEAFAIPAFQRRAIWFVFALGACAPIRPADPPPSERFDEPCDMRSNPLAPMFVSYSPWQLTQVSAPARELLVHYTEGERCGESPALLTPTLDGPLIEAGCARALRGVSPAYRTACLELCTTGAWWANAQAAHESMVTTLERLRVAWARCGANEQNAAVIWACGQGEALLKGFSLERLQHGLRLSGTYRPLGARWIFELDQASDCGRSFYEVHQISPTRSFQRSGNGFSEPVLLDL